MIPHTFAARARRVRPGATAPSRCPAVAPAARRAATAGLVALATAATLAGCAGPALQANIDAARADVRARAGIDFDWLTSDAARARARDEVAARLAQPLSADDAVRIALAYSPALQAALFQRAATSADATQSARLPNPVFEFERLVGGAAPAHVEVTRSLTLPVLDLLLWPARARRADAVQRGLRVQLAADVLRAAVDTHAAWIAAVAARQAVRYAEQVRDAAEAGAELARRLEAAGNFSTLQRAREEAFTGNALAELAQARRAERTTREALVRALGLDTAQAATLALPDRLPDLPATPPPEDTQHALDDRLDLRLARAELDAVARAQGLTRVTGVIDGLRLDARRYDETGEPHERGVALSIPLPVFDAGDAARAGAQARYRAALEHTAAVAVDAASQLRAAQGDARDAWTLAQAFREHLVPLDATIVGENLLRYNGMLASVFDLLADARAQARTVQRAIAAQRDFWLADAALRAATIGLPAWPTRPSDSALLTDTFTETASPETPR